MAEGEVRFKNCDNQIEYTPPNSILDLPLDTYSPNSIFSTNLDRALDTLKNNTALTGFSSTSVGSVTALALCRGDLTSQQCQNCTDRAMTEIRQHCPNATSAQTWYSYCMIRYSNVNFLQKQTSNETTFLSLFDTRLAPYSEVFNEKVQVLMKNLSVAAGASDKRFALGWTNVTDTVYIYGYLDCTRDLSSDNCTKCLVSTVDHISCCFGKWAVWIVTPTCQVQFSLDPNFNLTLWGATKVFTDSTIVLKSPSTVISGSKKKLRKTSLILIIVFGVAGLLALVFVCLWLLMIKKRTMSIDKRTQAGNVEETTTSESLGMIGSSYSYDFELLVAATDNFSSRNKLGAGGFGIVYKVCNNQATYTPDSIFSTDLDRALDTVKNNTALTSFSTTSVGSVTVLAICRGDVSAVGCQDCTHSATSEIRQYCPNTTSAQTWYTYCMIRYSNVDFLQKPNEIALLSLYDTRQAPHPEIFNEKVQALVKNLSVTAGAREKRFALGWTNVMDTFTLYGYLDCTRDLSSDNCTKCLVSTADNIRCCLGKWAVWLATATCQIQISLDNNFNLTLGGATEVFTNTTMMLEAPSVVVTRSKSNLRLVSLIFSIVVGVAGVLALVFVSLWLVMTKKRRKKKVSMDKRTQAGDVEETTTSENLGMIVSSYSYDFELLVAATDNFSTRNKLGAGGFGIVYKGRMPNGEEIAVKKLQDGSMQGTEEFSNEVMLLLRIQHRNLVKLMGYCFHGEEKMLVYEYLSNKSLDFIIFDRSLSALLDWPKRFNIILGVARGLLYLHEDSQPKIIHRDIKAGNVLLDQNMNPKISDFGLAKPFPEEQSRLRTRRIAGTVQVYL
ncbi:hypothetical protein GIB67_040741 [Kingdonia uniflora]|uniref:non-specific serine/threonine protein kinase n=1 Tax=Kingdonia uniflora TaxID=39325 RepID=A0A7J7KUH5_9MAGN|nr:hypothetical protein GIB67_040741 [Kingdonia uniflora]